MFPFIDWFCAPCTVLGVAGLFWLRHVLGRVPKGNVFLLSPQVPSVGSPQLVIPVLSGLWMLGMALWIGGRSAPSEPAAFAGMLVLGSVAVIGLIVGFLLSRQVSRAAGTLTFEAFGTFETEPAPVVELVVAGETRRVLLSPGCIRIWPIGHGLAQMFSVQLAIGPDAETGIALYAVDPASRHFQLTQGAPWLKGFTGFTAVTRKNDLLDLLAPFVVAGS